MAKQSSTTKKSSSSSKGSSSKGSSSKSSSSKSNSKSASSNGGGSEPQLEEFFVDMLKDIYWAEKHLTKALPKLSKAATTEELKQAFDNHMAQTQEHVSRLEQVFEMVGKKAQAKKCDAMDGLTKEADTVIQDTEKGSMTRDVALIVSAQKVEHYEIASYGSLVQIANTMNMSDAAEILEQTLQEEKDTDALLTDIAVNNVNTQAEAEDSEEGEEEGEEEEE